MESEADYCNTLRIFYIIALIASCFLLIPQMAFFFEAAGLRWLRIFFVAFALSFCITPLLIWLAFRINILDAPAERKMHHTSTPLLGGVAIFIGFLVSLMANGIYSDRFTVILITSTVLFIVGVIDDARELPAWLKLVMQILCTLCVMYFGIVLAVIPEALGIFAVIANWVITIIWIIGITNAMNFIDGIDGMAAGIGAIISFFMGVVAFQTNQPFLAWISIAMMAACLGFLPYNFRKNKNALIFLGDAGSTFLGYVLACVAVYGEWAEGNTLAALAPPLLIFWILIFDMIHITVERVLTGKVKSVKEWIDYVGKDHIPHRFEQLFDDKWKGVICIYILGICFGISAIVLRNAGTMDVILLITQAAAIIMLATIMERRGRSFKK